MINYKLRLFTPWSSSYGAEEMTPKSQLCACSFPGTIGTKPFEYAACGCENLRIRKKIFVEKKISGYMWTWPNCLFLDRVVTEEAITDYKPTTEFLKQHPLKNEAYHKRCYSYANNMVGKITEC